MNAGDPVEKLGYRDHVDIRIGIANSPREITFESTQTADVEKVVADALDGARRTSR